MQFALSNTSKTSFFGSTYRTFGMQLPERNESVGDSYRYSFQGMEGDSEIKGQGNSYTTEFRQYDPRIGRWLSLDPLMAKYPGMSPYTALNNNPITFVDPDGLEGQDWVKGGTSADGKKTYDKNTWHWEKDVNSKSDADALGAVDWIGKDQSRTITAENGKRVTLSYDAFLDKGQADWENTTETPEPGISPFLWAQVSSVGPTGPITNPGAGVFMLGNNSDDFKELRSAWGSSQGWKQFNGYVNNFAWQTSMFAGGEALFGVFPVSGYGGTSSTRVFWSGGNTAKSTAASFAKANGMKTLEMTTRGRVMNTLNPILPRSISNPIWRNLSKNFAEGAKYESHFFTTPAGPRPGSIWLNIEKPILQKNGVNILTH